MLRPTVGRVGRLASVAIRCRRFGGKESVSTLSFAFGPGGIGAPMARVGGTRGGFSLFSQVASSRHRLFTGGLSRLPSVKGCSRKARDFRRFTIHVTTVLRSPRQFGRLCPCLGGIKCVPSGRGSAMGNWIVAG